MNADRNDQGFAIFLALPLLLMVATAFEFSQLLPPPGDAAFAPTGYRWVTHANTVLSGAALVYLAHYWLENERIGQAASMLAALGAVGVPVGLFADAGPAAARAGWSLGLYEGTALFSAAAVAVYLAMERVYRNRAAAMLIMPAVFMAVLCEIWLVAQDIGAVAGPGGHGLSGYWVVGQRFAASLGYAALAVSALLGAGVLMCNSSGNGLSGMQAEAIIGAAGIGAPMFLIGTGMGAAWSIAIGSRFTLDGAGMTVPALVAALALLAWVRMARPRLRSLAWFSVLAFCVSTTGLLPGLLGVSGGFPQ